MRGPVVSVSVGLLLFSFSTGPTEAQPSCDDAVRRAEMLAGDGAFEGARDLLDNCCDSLDSVERFDCLRVLLHCLTLLGERRRASETAHAMVVLDPAARLTPSSVTPRALALFDSVRTASVGGLSVRSEPTGADLAFDGVPLGHTTPWMWYALGGQHEVCVSKEGYRDVVMDVEVVPGVLEPLVTTLKRGSRRSGTMARVEPWRSAVLPGWGHLRAGEKRGWGYAAAVLGASVISAASYGQYVSAVDDYNGAVDRLDEAGASAAYDDVKKARGAWLTWAGVAAGVYVLNVVDAWLF